MEFLNNTRNTSLYADDPLAPSTYSPAYLFATVMFASPLARCELSNLPADYIAQINRPTAQFHLPILSADHYQITPIAGAGSATLSPGGIVSANIDTPRSYLWLHLHAQ